MRCSQCGEQLPNGAHFCGQCGASVPDLEPAAKSAPVAESARVAEPASAAAAAPVAEVGAAAEPAPVEAAAAPGGASGKEGAAAKDLIGQTIAGRYRLLRQVGEGGMGTVYEAEQTLGSSRRAVAVKLLRPEWSHDPSVKARFHREAATVARLEHFNTVRIYDFGAMEDGTLFIVMEFLQGRSLQSVLEDQGALPAERVQHIVTQAAASLDEAHRLGIVHRDLKPDNFLLLDNYASQRDVLKLVDFGIAKGDATPGGSTTKLTEFGAFVGTPGYMSPEQFIGGGASPQSDIYSLAITTYQMLAGRLPFEAESVMQWAQAHLNASPPALEPQNARGPIPEAMRAAVSRALSKSPSHRQGTAIEFARELSGAVIDDAVRSTAKAPSAAPLLPALDGPGAESPRAEPARAAGPAPTFVQGAGGMKTAPMTELPDVAGQGGARKANATQPMAEFRYDPSRARPNAHPTPATYERPRMRTGRLVALAILVPFVGAAAVIGFFALRGYRVFPWQTGPAVDPPSIFAPAAGGGAESPAPSRAEPPESPPVVAQRPERPAPARPSQPARPAAPAKAPDPAAPATPAPAPTPPVTTLPTELPPGSLPGLPSLPGSAGAPGQPQPAPSVPTSPALPWNLPTAGACERCLAALQGSGNYIVVSAIGENLLCEDRTARDLCEGQIIAQAPIVAERAARGGDCPAALATVAAAMNVRISPDAFREVNALCLR
jgi:eukaryotic-like serine/threonine-protein kinase